MGLKEKTYRVLIVGACKSDKTGKRFSQGETFGESDFDAAVLVNWLELGIIEEVK